MSDVLYDLKGLGIAFNEDEEVIIKLEAARRQLEQDRNRNEEAGLSTRTEDIAIAKIEAKLARLIN